MVVISSHDLRNFTGFCIKVVALIQFTQEYIHNHKDINITYDVPELNCVFDITSPTVDVLNCGVEDNKCNSGVIVDVKEVKLKSKIFHNIFKIKNNYNYDTLLTDNTLAIQLRGTDKDSEVPRVSDGKIISDVQSFLISHPNIDRIFLATDDEHYRNLIVTNFDNVVYNDYIRSTDGSPIHLYSKHPTDILYSQVLNDCHTISKCKYFIYCFSNVSFLAMIMGINNFVDIQCFNV